MDGENGDHRQLRASGMRATDTSARRGDARPRFEVRDNAVRQDGRPDRAKSRARRESNLGFRVGGKVVERLVDVGRRSPPAMCSRGWTARTSGTP